MARPGEKPTTIEEEQVRFRKMWGWNRKDLKQENILDHEVSVVERCRRLVWRRGGGTTSGGVVSGMRYILLFDSTAVVRATAIVNRRCQRQADYQVPGSLSAYCPVRCDVCAALGQVHPMAGTVRQLSPPSRPNVLISRVPLEPILTVAAGRNRKQQFLVFCVSQCNPVHALSFRVEPKHVP